MTTPPTFIRTGFPRPAFYEKPVPVFAHRRLLALEDEELLIRIQLGTSYGRTGLNKDRLNRVLENELWYQVPSGKFKGSSSKGKRKVQQEFKGGMLIEKPPKGKGERPDKRPLPKGRWPNPRLGKGEGIEPFEMFSEALDKFYQESKQHACAWFSAFDVGSFNRTDIVHHPLIHLGYTRG